MVTRHIADLDDQEAWPRQDPVWINAIVVVFIIFWIIMVILAYLSKCL